MRTSVLVSCLIVAAGAAFAAAPHVVLAGPAPTAAAPHGYWALSKGPDGVKAGLIFPDFSPNEFVGLTLMCQPKVRTVTVTSDLGDDVMAGEAVTVEIRLDGAATPYAARVERSEMDDGLRATFTTTLDDPTLTDLARTKSLSVAVNGKARPLPVRELAVTMFDFLSKCRR